MKKSLTFVFLFLSLWTVSFAESCLLPLPKSIKYNNGSFNAKNVSIVGDSISIVESFIGEIGGKISEKASNKISIKFGDFEKAAVNKTEGYEIKISRNKIDIYAQSQHGVFNAVQTLRQLTDNKGGIKCADIVDWPSFRVRGFMQDVGRTYISVDELKKEIDILSKYKINVFHWHLTENQSWRLQSKIFPMLNDSVNTIRMRGKYYTLEEARDLVNYCKERHVTLIPEIDMPGHSEAFKKTFRHDMQSPEGMKILKLLVEEVCDNFDVPYIHIGTDEVEFTNKDFVPEMVSFIRGKGKKVISWNPGWNYKPGEIDMTQLWSYRGKAQKGIPAIDSRLHYLNHYDLFGDVFSLFNSKIYNVDEGSDDIAGCIVALWHDRYIPDEQKILLENNFYPSALALADRAWRGGGNEYFDKQGVNIPFEKNAVYDEFENFESRLLYHKNKFFKGLPFIYFKQTNKTWNITDAFPNDGDLKKSFEPEIEIKDSYTCNGRIYNVNQARGAGFYLRHVWGSLIPAFYKDPKPNHTAYAYTYVYSDKKVKAGVWIETQNYSRSEMDLAPENGKWDYKKSRVWINNNEVEAPKWSSTHRVKSNETPLENENFVSREPIEVTLEKGWNKVLLKLPVGNFSSNEIRLQKWMFSLNFVDINTHEEIAGLVYSHNKSKY
ncbi:MAG: family 20 glycosylhydrolase [Bacteroidales bacterium]|nr:family 20 glycosylhydrolase [Bacteroidales bacterium]